MVLVHFYYRPPSKGIANGYGKGTRQRHYFGLLENVGANKHGNSHKTFKGLAGEVPSMEIFGVCLYTWYVLGQSDHDCCRGGKGAKGKELFVRGGTCSMSCKTLVQEMDNAQLHFGKGLRSITKRINLRGVRGGQPPL